MTHQYRALWAQPTGGLEGKRCAWEPHPLRAGIYGDMTKHMHTHLAGDSEWTAC